MKTWRRELEKLLVAVGLKEKAVQISPDEQAFLRSIFVAPYYARQAGLSKQDDAAMFGHFLRHGLRLNLSPTPLFNREIFHAQGGTEPVAGTPDVLWWYRSRGQSDIIPTTFFDAEVYQSFYTDIIEAGLSPFEHYLRHGLSEGRRPNAVFDPQWYESIADRRVGEEALPAYIHFLVYGIERGGAPNVGLLPVFWRTPTARINPDEVYARIDGAVRPWAARLGADQTRTLLLLFNPDTYTGGGDLDGNASGVQRLEHFLEKGLSAGLNPGPMFDSEFYANEAGLAHDNSVNRLLHFLETGPTRRIVPTPLFNRHVYEEAWPDMRKPEIWGFAHFIEHGLYEGRKIDGLDRVGAWSLPPDSAGGQFHNWDLFWNETNVERVTFDASKETVQTVPALVPGRKLADHDLPLVRALFVPRYYALRAGLEPELSAESLLEHYLVEGIDRDFSPGPLFDPEIARALSGVKDEPALHSWLRMRQPNWRAPTRYFDKEFYRSYYREFQGVDFDLFEHYTVHGLRENRVPNLAFDPVWYTQAYAHPAEEQGMPAYLHYLLFGAERGLAPSRLLLTAFDRVGNASQPGLTDFLAICCAGEPWLARLDADKLQAMIAMFSPYTYDAGGALPASASGARRLVNFLEKGAQGGLAPSPLFDPALYDGSGFDADEPPLVHYLRKGWPKRQIATRLYSEEAYQAAHADIRAHNIWGFRHFLFHGLFEGRKIDECARLTLFPKVDDIAGRELNNARIFWAASGVPSEIIVLPTGVGRTQQRLNEVLASSIMAESVRRAVTLDPAVGDFRKGDAYHAPPFHDQAYPTISKLQDRIPDKRYGTIICVPCLRVGGADLVACQLAEAVKLARPDENVLLLRVDAPNLDRPDWVPEGVDVALISDVLGEVPEDVGERLIYTLMKILEPKRLINVNSYRSWRTLERFGLRLRPYVNLYSYMFCWDQTADGIRVGYPSMFYASTAPNLTGLLTDTNYLRDELGRMYRPPREIAERTVALFTPSRTEPPKVAVAKVAADKASGGRPRVLWAGRLDQQKRFDLVQKISARMPNVDFLCWGHAVLDSPPDMTQSPRNLTLRPGFKQYLELPFDDADLWLFTSAWEGMPTILIEIAVRGVSVVASSVGGVPELIDERTGYPVDDVGNVDAYVAAIADAIKHPAQRVKRAQALQKLAVERYSQHRYVRDLRALFDKED